MDFFDKHKALIITSFIFAILLLGLYNFNLSNSNQKTREFLVDLDQYKPETESEEEVEQEEQETEQQQSQQPQTHRAFNENQEAREQNFDSQLNEIFEKNSASREETSEEESQASNGDFNVSKPERNRPQQRSDGNNSSENTSTQSGGIDNSSITYSLKGRTAYEIPNPIYTCDVPGKIVVNITVNAEGLVQDTRINKASSTSSNACLEEMALQYAAGARFSRLAGRDSQPGTISYQFKP
ncbi:energy transducer TonB [Salegentibacter sp. F188]|uniref:Energy transducer TonB n=1 Tax=Autumnicola patrickiae TaxID=3075591 RepID=A0ABU3E1U7_9FLAO|nr:energy transducer TonB [Salegentibacter sp. F188]MDT0689943.1 energy transducer TonB [Salegentibacter sp. F188]